MDFRTNDDQVALVESFSSLLSRYSSFDAVRDAEPTGFDPVLWKALLDVGALTMALEEGHGGWGASLVDLVLVAETLGRFAAPAPLVETQVAARLISRCRSQAADQALSEVLAGEALTTLALHPSVDGAAPLVPAGAVCDYVVVHQQNSIRSVEVSASTRRPVANLASAPLADLSVLGGTTLAEGLDVADLVALAIDEWLVLTAATVLGVGAVALELACEYAVERRAFGAQIGSFQGISHPLANDVTDLEGAQLLVRKAAWALDRGDTRARELAAMAFGVSVRAAQSATYDALHTFGGYGFMVEHDVQLLYRRARGWPQVWGDPAAANARAAAARYGDRVPGSAA